MRKKVLVSVVGLLVIIALAIVVSIVVCRQMYGVGGETNGGGAKNMVGVAGSGDDNAKQESYNFTKAFNEGKFDEIIAEVNKELEKKKDDKDLLEILAGAYLQKGSLEFKEEEFGQKGLEVADKVLALNKQDYKAYYLKGYAYEIMQKYDQALENYNKANSIKETALVDNQIGHVYDLQGDNVKAREYYQKALAIDKDFVDAKINLARMAFSEKKYQEAVDVFADVYQQTANKRKKSDAAYMMGLIYLKKGGAKYDLKKAERSMQMAVEADQENPNAWLGLGMATYQKAFEDKNVDFKKYMDMADRSFRMAIKLNPEKALAYLHEARLLLVNGNKKDAALLYNKALTVVDSDITLMADEKLSLKSDIKGEMKRAKIVEKKVSFLSKFFTKVSKWHFIPVARAELDWDAIFQNDTFDGWESRNWGAGNGHGDYLTRDLSIVVDGVSIEHLRYFYTREEAMAVVRDIWGTNSDGDRYIDIIDWSHDGYAVCDNTILLLWGELNHSNPHFGSADGVAVGPSGPDNTKLCEDGSTASTVNRTGEGTQSNPYVWQWTCSKNNKTVGCSTDQDSNTYLSELKCGPANGYGPSGDGFDRTSEVIDAGRCPNGMTMTNWVDHSSLADSGAVAWTWKCERDGESVDCDAKKKGECADIENAIKPPYSSYDKACRFGSFNSVVLDGNKFKWKCGTGEEPKTVGSFYPGDSRYINKVVPVDYFGPHDGGVNCECVPQYKYTCVKVADADCGGRCGSGQFGDELYQAFKEDTHCFPNDAKQAISNNEYNAAPASQKNGGPAVCANKKVQCAPCGVNDGEGGDAVHEN